MLYYNSFICFVITLSYRIREPISLCKIMDPTKVIVFFDNFRVVNLSIATKVQEAFLKYVGIPEGTKWVPVLLTAV